MATGTANCVMQETNEIERSTHCPSKQRTSIRRLPARQRERSTLRARVASNFREIGQGVDAETAFRRTKDFYLTRGCDWTRGLS